jgi:hypothetical protein
MSDYLNSLYGEMVVGEREITLGDGGMRKRDGEISESDAKGRH